jgi:hypothetical protein
MLQAARSHLAALAVAASLLTATFAGVSHASAEDLPVDLELVLAVDISWSMDPEEQQLQRDGYVQAFRDPEIHRAIRSGAYRRIAVTYVEWAGPHAQSVVVPWTVVGTAIEAISFAEALSAAPILRDRMTSISTVLKFSGELFADRPASTARRVIDISGDGPNNAGTPVTEARDALVADGVIINGLPIVVRPSRASMFDIDFLVDYYEGCVIGGPASFAIPIRERGEFLTATRQKLLLEIAGIEQPRLHRVQFKPEKPPIDCMIGERLWQRYMDR